ncbi:ParB N-terminal domain-containing protein [Clostridium intestinale]|uniref:ParB/RepB/Spo0J family partition protein n=1 Tax=Clostridium intestinale TaxID=36845 RepID=UPI0028E43797|nr:ParB N-terminal domain-containing protein [Clostridium intestinale]
MFLQGLSEKVNSFDAKDKFSLLEINIDLLEPSTNNFYGIREIDELSESIKEQGLLHNLVVREKEGKYEILSGERRYHALKKLGFKKVPCKVQRNLSDIDSEILLIEANARTRELTPSEFMRGISRLEEIYKAKKSNGEQIEGKTREAIGKVLGKSGTQVGRYQKINKKLSEDLKEDLDKDKLTVTQAEIISNLKPQEQKEIAKQIKNLDPKESKEEISILIEGIKQPVEKKRDKELLKEIYPEPKPKEKKPKTTKFAFENKEQLQTIQGLCEEMVKTLKSMLPKKGQKWTEFDHEVKGQYDAFDLMMITLRDHGYSDELVFEMPGMESGEEDE